MARLRLRLVAALFLLSSALLAACGSDDSGDGDNPGVDEACIDRPDTLPRPPEGRLPCDLIPPGLSL